jgi:hypothetical protein
LRDVGLDHPWAIQPFSNEECRALAPELRGPCLISIWNLSLRETGATSRRIVHAQWPPKHLNAKNATVAWGKVARLVWRHAKHNRGRKRPAGAGDEGHTASSSCSRPVLQQNGCADARRPCLLNGGHKLCVESWSQHDLTPATPCAVTRAHPISPAVARHLEHRVAFCLFANPWTDRWNFSQTKETHSFHQQKHLPLSPFTFLLHPCQSVGVSANSTVHSKCAGRMVATASIVATGSIESKPHESKQNEQTSQREVVATSLFTKHSKKDEKPKGFSKGKYQDRKRLVPS